ncbi:MAG: hypothetical protein ACI4EF_00705 [Coprococcus sp.]
MDITVNEISYIHASPYITRARISQEFDMSLGSVDKRIKEIKSEIEKGRYSEMAIIKDGGFCMVNYLVFIDYMKNRGRLTEKNLRKNVPDYNPKAVAYEIGWYGDDIPATAGSQKRLICG